MCIKHIVNLEAIKWACDTIFVLCIEGIVNIASTSLLRDCRKDKYCTIKLDTTKKAFKSMAEATQRVSNEDRERHKQKRRNIFRCDQ